MKNKKLIINIYIIIFTVIINTILWESINFIFNNMIIRILLKVCLILLIGYFLNYRILNKNCWKDKKWRIKNLKNISLEEKCKLLKKFNLIKECEE